MAEPLRLLIVEDDPNDAELSVAVLTQAGYELDWERVETRQAFLDRLKSNTYDLILSDYSLPTFDGLTALQLAMKAKVQSPFILISGTLGEETAIDSLKAGATDYVLKDRITRLPLVVARALREREEHAQRQHAEAAHRAAEMRYRELFENASDIMYTHDMNGYITSINRMAEQLTGYTRAEALALHVDEIISPPYLPLVYERLRRRPVDDYSSVVYELEILCKDGSILPVEVNTRPIVQNGRIVGVQGSARDVSERRRAQAQQQALEAQLAQAQKMETVGTLAGGIAHDFNNLLSAILGNAQLALGSLPETQPEYIYLSEIEQTAERAAALARQLLTFSRRQQLQREPLDLNRSLEHMINMLRRLIGEDIRIETGFEPNLWPVFADRTQIDQVIMNLAINARDAMPNGGYLVISTANCNFDEDMAVHYPELLPGRYVEITVRDTGIGMDLQTQSRIFEPFFTTKPVGSGTGLGLAVVYGIVKQHEGFIRVRSTPQQGTIFAIALPAYGVMVDNQE